MFARYSILLLSKLYCPESAPKFESLYSFPSVFKGFADSSAEALGSERYLKYSEVTNVLHESKKGV